LIETVESDWNMLVGKNIKELQKVIKGFQEYKNQ